jgi:polyisoprenoid-binding protein YceI
MATQTSTKWSIDPAHSEVVFKVKHLMISTVSGKFDKYAATVETDGDDFTTAKINFSADVNSVNTGNEQRDGHLKAPDFFDVAQYPQITFTSTKFEKVSGDNYTLHGDLTIKSVTKNIQLAVEYNGTGKDPYGNIKAGFGLTGKINRSDFGLSWNVPLENGVMLGEEIKVSADVQFLKQA